MDNQKSDPIQLIIWYKDNTTGSPIYSIDARSVDSLEKAAVFSPSKQFDGRLFFDPKSFPISLVIDPVIEGDSGQYFCRVVSTLISSVNPDFHSLSLMSFILVTRISDGAERLLLPSICKSLVSEIFVKTNTIPCLSSVLQI